MSHKTVKLQENTILGVIGDIHEHESQFDEIVEKFQPSEDRILVSLGDIYDKGFGIKVAQSVTDKLKALSDKGFSYTVLGNHDFRHIRKGIRSGKELTKQLTWLEQQPVSISFKFPNGKSVLVLHGGITPKYNWENLGDTEIMYIRSVDKDGNSIPMKKISINGKTILGAERKGLDWHDLYDGRFGYICAGHSAQKDGIPKYYPYSCNIDTACYSTGILTCQTFDQKGLLDKIFAYGPTS